MKIGEKELQRRAQREARAEGRKVAVPAKEALRDVIKPVGGSGAKGAAVSPVAPVTRDAVSPVSPAGPVAADPDKVPLEDAGLGDAMVSTRSRSKHRASMKEVMRKRRAKGLK